MLFKTITLTLLFVSSQLWAHAELKTSLPKNGAMLMQSPEKLQLEFTKAVRLIKVTLSTKAGQNIPLNFDGTSKASIVHSILIPKLSPSNYQVNWLAMGGDTHKMKGRFNFNVNSNEANATNTRSNKTAKNQDSSAVSHSH